MKQCGTDIQLIISDIDGTLLTNKNVLLSSTEKAVRNIIDHKKCAFTLSTGRSFIFTNPLAKHLKINVPFTFSGGGLFDPIKKKVIYAPEIGKQQIDKIALIGKKFEVGLLAHTIHGLYCLVNDDDWRTIISIKWMKGKKVGQPQRINNIQTDIPDEIIRLDLFAEVNWLSKVQVEVQNTVDDVDAILMSRSIEIFKKGMDKGSALVKISNLLSIPLKNTMAIGDSLNDLPLLKVAGFRVAMETAPLELKKVADLIVPSSDDGGLEKALQKIS